MLPLLQVKDLKIYYSGFRGTRVVKAVDGVSFSLEAGETPGLVGESGCGKTTTSKLILAAEEPTAGTIVFAGRNLAQLDSKGLIVVSRECPVSMRDGGRDDV